MFRISMHPNIENVCHIWGYLGPIDVHLVAGREEEIHQGVQHHIGAVRPQLIARQQARNPTVQVGN
jgi:hypothetical protein